METFFLCVCVPIQIRRENWIVSLRNVLNLVDIAVFFFLKYFKSCSWDLILDTKMAYKMTPGWWSHLKTSSQELLWHFCPREPAVICLETSLYSALLLRGDDLGEGLHWQDGFMMVLSCGFGWWYEIFKWGNLNRLAMLILSV